MLTRTQDEKDSLRMELYFSNHDHLKKLIGEEREYPFRALPTFCVTLLTLLQYATTLS